ncbi:hypothetical protein C7B62_02885 [Pleurocapsa sp. CCALA 161]|uniref:hypothetical protein n=1 Tax=Pleurocapsa sp. CCALA 161 TaxID=2107688 RepID=UPI000D049075|nr:hypothetical protein [Pleurocapsa sp. CCALA 161]PSB12201.1 hypothetical protein C7B62_02885 [Pleurocapsa sp. CCALA 161]
MSALRKPDFSTDYYYPQAQPHEVVNQPNIVQRSPEQPTKLVKPKAFRTNNLPKKLQTLSLIQKSSFGLAIATMTASISLYVSTVKIPDLWSQEYQHLENLQLQERQLVAVNETIKYQLAQAAGQDKRLTIPEPESAIFVSPAQVQARKPVDRQPSQQEIAKLKYESLGY